MAFANNPSPPPLRFSGHQHLTTRLILSTLTGRPVHITRIRSDSIKFPGLASHEVSFIRLLESITNGSHIEFSHTGTALLYRPGLLSGSAPGFGADARGVVRHVLPADCGRRGISFFLAPLCLLAPFAKAPVNVLFTGPGVVTAATEEAGDVSVDTLRTAMLPYFGQFGVPEQRVEIRTIQRSCQGPGGMGGAGEVQLVFQAQVRLPKTVHLLNPGKVKSICGVAYAVGVSGINNKRMIEAARAVLNQLVPDTRIFSENTNAGFVTEDTVQEGTRTKSTSKRKVGVGFGLSLVAETSTAMRYSADVVAPPEGGVPPEDIGRRCALQLLEVISQGGCVGRIAAPTVLTLMAMGGEDVGRVVLGKQVLADEGIIQLARDFRTFGLSAWGLRDAEDENADDAVVVSVVGKGVGNVGRKIA